LSPRVRARANRIVRHEQMTIEQRRFGEVSCSFCGGSGKDPFGIMSYLSTCCVCGGRGLVSVLEPHVSCPHCHGTGAIKTLTCTACSGKGVVPAPAKPWTMCPECLGDGDDSSASSLPCLRCHGRGWIER